MSLRTAKSADLAASMSQLTDAQPIHEEYSLSFSNNYLLRGVVKMPAAEAFIPHCLH